MLLGGRASNTGIMAVAVAGLSLAGSNAAAFPPYRSTDADTADPYVMQLRVGIVDLDHTSDKTEITSPLLRANVGLPRRIEITAELDYQPEADEIGDGAIGLKWIPLFGKDFSFGMETLALLPVRPSDSGVGAEYKLIATFWREDIRLHCNAGGFNDTRISPAEDGWKASVLAEFPQDSYRPGVELSAVQVGGDPIEASVGIGSIFDVDPFTIRVGVHVGLTQEAPDVELNLWITTEFPVRR